MRRLCAPAVVIASLVLAPTCGAASVQLVLPTSSFGSLGLRGAPASVSRAREDLVTGLPPSAAHELDRAATQASAASGRGEQLRSDAFVLGSARAASSLLAAWRRARHADRVSLGRDGSEAVSHGVALVAWREGARIGVVRLSGPRGLDVGSTALAFARLADTQLTATEPSSAWGRVAAQIGPTGTVSEQTALGAFALAYGPLPGVKMPSGGLLSLPSGTPAAAWAWRFRSRLPRRLRQAIYRDLGLSAGAAGAHAASFGDPHFHQNTTLTDEANGWAKIYADGARLGHVLGMTIVAGTSTSGLKEALGDALPVDAAGSMDFNGPYCRIRVKPPVLKSPSELALTLAHETFHCFQFDLDHNWIQLPAWIIEGTAEWGSLSVIPAAYDTPSAEGWLLSYILTQPIPLFKRTDDAVGFFGHAQDAGVDIWKTIPAILNPSYVPEEGRFAAAGGDSDAFLDSWGSSVFLLGLGGAPWDMHSPVASFMVTAPTIKVSGDEIVDTPAPYTTRQYRVQAVSGAPVLAVDITGHARLSATYNYTDLKGALFCMSEPCVCPPMTTGFVPPTKPLLPSSALGLSSNSKVTAGSLLYYPLSFYCHPIPTPPSGGGGGGGTIGCHEDCGSTGGDPHVTTFAGDSYDFQAVGEFTVLKSRSGDLNVQVRQQPWPGSGDVSVDTAVAIRAGNATVEVDAGKPSGKEIVLVNRARLPSGGTQRRSLSGGVKLLAVGDLADLTWPDGSIVQVTAGTDSGCGNELGVAVKVARKRFGHLSGLLGDAGAASGTEFVGGNGRRYSAVEIEDAASPQGFNALYHEFGPSWRISQQDSLFDYPKGKSTSRYTDSSFPNKALTLGRLTSAQFAAGEQTCAAKGVTNASLLGDCVLDVSATLKKCFADAAKRLQDTTGGPPALAGGVSPIGWTQLSAHTDADPMLYPSLAIADGRPIAAYQTAGVSGIEAATFTASPTGVGSVGTSEPVAGWRDIDGGPLLFGAPGGGLQMIFSGDHTAATRDPLNGTSIAPLEPGGTFGPPVNAGVKPYPSTGAKPHVDSGALLAGDGQTPVWTATSGFSLQLERGAQDATSADLSGIVPNQVPHDPNLARDSSGRLWLAWYAQTHDPSTNGQWMLQLDPTGAGPAPGATPQHAPDSGLNFGTIDAPALVCSQSCRIVYKDSSEDKIVLWSPGQTTPTTLASDPGQVLDPTAVYTASGRLWLTWIEVSTERVLSELVSSNGTGGQPIILQKPTGYATPLYSASVLDGSLLALVTNWSTQDQSQTAVFATVIAGGG